jgi:hypothetical protein
MADQHAPSPVLLRTLFAFVLSLIAAGLITGYECQVGTTDQCLMSKGFFPYYWGVLFIVSWLLAASLGFPRRRSPEDTSG